MLCQFFRCRKKIDINSCDTKSFIKQKEEINNHKEESSKWFSHKFNLTLKDFNYLFSLIEKCLKLSLKPEINLRTNPPYLPSILRNFNIKILSIIKFYNQNLSELSNNYFFRILIWTLIKLCKEIIGIFNKKSKTEEMQIVKQKLIHYSFILSYLFHSLVALFPNNSYSPESFRITKSDASEWWYSHFGLTTTVIKWKHFIHIFSKINDISNYSQINALKKTINITGSGFVTIFDFDVFVRLFQPWNNIIETWKVLIEHPGCMPFLSYEQVVHCLKTFKYCPGTGSYIFRFSCTKPGQWAIGYIDISGKIFQTIVHNKSLPIALSEGEQTGLYKFPNGTIYDSTIIHSLTALPPQNILVSQEEHDAYCIIDSSFEICKICELNHKNVRLEPCGHLLCDFCLTKWQKSFRYQGCPFCRFQIKGVESVSLVPFKKNSPLIESKHLDCPALPPRFSSIISSSTNLNYVKLDWLSLNDSGYCMYSNYDDDNDEEDNEQVKVEASEDKSNVAQYHNTFNSFYLNDNACSTSSGNIDSMHISDDNEVAMKQLLKITNNDLSMSQEILRYFALRSAATNS